jgi:hypothetical protein
MVYKKYSTATREFSNIHHKEYSSMSRRFGTFFGKEIYKLMRRHPYLSYREAVDIVRDLIIDNWV